MTLGFRVHQKIQYLEVSSYVRARVFNTGRLSFSDSENS